MGARDLVTASRARRTPRGSGPRSSPNPAPAGAPGSASTASGGISRGYRRPWPRAARSSARGWLRHRRCCRSRPPSRSRRSGAQGRAFPGSPRAARPRRRACTAEISPCGRANAGSISGSSRPTGSAMAPKTKRGMCPTAGSPACGSGPRSAPPRSRRRSSRPAYSARSPATATRRGDRTAPSAGPTARSSSASPSRARRAARRPRSSAARASPQADRLCLQIHPGAARRGHTETAAERRAERHPGRRDLVLGLIVVTPAPRGARARAAARTPA